MTSVFTPPPTLDGYRAWMHSFRAATVAARLVESDAVHEARAAMGRLLDALGEKIMDNVEADMRMIDALGVPYVEAREQLAVAGRALSSAIRADLGLSADDERSSTSR